LLQIVNNGTSLIMIFAFGAGISYEWFNLVQLIAMFGGIVVVGLTKVSYGRGPTRMALSKGSARSSVYSKNPFQHRQHRNTLSSALAARKNRNTLSSALAAAEQQQPEYVLATEELL